jgi:hypothetical protein
MQNSDPSPALMLAARLSRWQILDLVLVERQGRMTVCANRVPCAPTLGLIRDRVLGMGGRGDYVMPGSRFNAVMAALREMGAIGPWP